MSDHSGVDVGGTPRDLTARPAGYSVVAECLSLQGQAIPRSKLKRILGFQPLHPDAMNWFTGAIGEIRVGRLLNQLGPEWTVLHAVPVGIRGSDIDHVLIGPTVVFTVSTEHHAAARMRASSASSSGARRGGEGNDELLTKLAAPHILREPGE